MEDGKEPVYASKAKPWLKYYDEKYIHQSVPECSAFALVCRNNERHLGDTALEYYGRKFSYADLIVQIKKTAAALQALGVKKGDIITVVSVMTPEVVYTFYAADLLGATLNLVDPRYSAEGIREYIEEVESRLLICLNVVYPRCHQAAKRTSVERVVVLSPADSLPLAKAVGYKLTEPDKNRYASNVLRWKDFIVAGKEHSPAAVPYDPQHTCVVVHTGGTTGSPKGVMLTDYCFNALAQEFAAQSRLFHRGQKLLNVMPPFIAYGYSCGIHMPLVMGLHIIIIPNLDPEKLGALVWKYKPEHMFGVPTHYQQLAADPLLKNKDLSFIRNYAAGGDAMMLCLEGEGVITNEGVPHTVQLHGEASDGQALRRELAPVRNIQCSARMILCKRLRRFFVIMVRVQVCEQKPAGLFVCAGSRYNFLPDRFRRTVKRRKLLRQCINQKTRFPGREDKSAVTDQSYLHCSMSRNSCSERTGMPSSFAFLSLLPAFSPATT